MEKLKKIRKEKGISCIQMAELVGLSNSYYWQIENNKRNLSYIMAIKISKILGLKPDDIFYEEFESKNCN